LFLTFSYAAAGAGHASMNTHERLTRETARDYQTEGCQATSQNDRLPDGQKTLRPKLAWTLHYASCEKKNKLFQFLQLHFKGETLALASLLPAAPLFPVSTHPYCFFLVWCMQCL